ncbi:MULTISPECIES: oxygenase MpaB family protein [unclassified Streptomyces]|uniref:oxygenase MpaB family protein n=1 Tax=unclassified Streptomyces TaxID=2593676 RepID=UPI0006AEAEAD|nr:MULTISPECIES: oxygenase MpaB family protein [unclassified Streptomyces]KOX20415.1 calcium-binding protein [Streptomyces sp. NRRL F-6491]KOX38713.1 calcium-binding protein [Streptomyces sp. NRRL F-6492]
MFGPGSQFHVLFNDPRWALAVIRATVLEAAHPQIGAALIDNSTFVAHPWRRLRNTFTSLQRMFGADDHVRQREAARLNRLHARLHGTDPHDRPYDAMDPDVRAWVVATLFESTVAMCRFGGQPLEQRTMERLYAEFQAFQAALGDRAGHLPRTLDEFWPYYDRVVAEELENTEAMRIILYKLFDHLPAPPVLNGFPALWATGRAVAGPVVGAITVASLPEPFRRRAGLPEIAGVQTLMQGTYLAAGLTRFLPEGWIRAENVLELLALSPDSDDPRARTVGALRDRMKRAAALVRLITPLPPEPAPTSGNEARRSAREFFAEVLDQTGDGYLDWPDLAAMARELSGRLDLDEPEESRLYTAYADWWRELQSALDADGDGRVSAHEYAAAAPSLAGPALIRVAEVLFDVTDKDGNHTIDADEYRALFRTAFQRDAADACGTYGRSAFVNDFLSFMSGRRRTTPYDPLLSDA